MEGILGYIRLVLKKNYLVNFEDLYLIYFQNLKEFPLLAYYILLVY